MDGAAAQVLDGANNFEETQSKFPNLRETRSKLGKVKGAVPVCGGGCSFLEKQHIIQKMKPNHHIVKMVQYDLMQPKILKPKRFDFKSYHTQSTVRDH